MTTLSLILLFISSARVLHAQTCPPGYALNTGPLSQNQTVDWVPCPTDQQPTLECGTFQVPLDYTDLEKGILTLSLVRQPATGNASDGLSIIMNPGGPGESGIQSLVESETSYLDDSGGGYHIVTWDPRGVGLTIPYQCPQLCTEQSTGTSLSDPAFLNSTFVSLKDQGEYCAEQPVHRSLGELVGTAFTARDVNAVSEAINPDGLIRYWGFSYGTLLGSTIAAMFPEKVDRMILDGNINPTDYYRGLNAEAITDVDPAVDHFFQTCATAGQEYCSLAKDGFLGEDLKNEFFTLLNNLKNGSSTLSSDSDESQGYAEVAGLLFTNLKSPSEWPVVAQNISAFYEAETPAARRVKREFDPLATFQISNPQALVAITCGDWVNIAGDLDDFESWLKLYEGISEFGADQLISILYSCATWPTRAKEIFEGSFEGVNTKHPILFINGPFDPVTPLVSAQNSSSGFVDSVVLEHNGAGHCSTASPSNCTSGFVRAYWQDGTLPDAGTVCQPDAAPFSNEPIIPSKRLMRRFDPNFKHPATVIGLTPIHLLNQPRPRQEPNICDAVAALEDPPVPATCIATTASPSATATATGGSGNTFATSRESSPP
ncbi:hypothetical protein PV10_08371 [Exophiala mesophila]|uniref:Peptidase S33 tripeptidyl aminopeptidase-like C-terminal domain-containing protein n=1 Tax=Exophiala mesophila TaxID=212818 RepID=A0A0D1ZPJ2_EXOME|nr:uncharacterized protein PV10_08371 [Exophiala mesophila]KIV88713.1 hypothetical protein PV10_08371 [Exophiala mesophila]